ncbi:MAG: hypothetical protein ACYC8T_23730, partial [Myxococcaceae bacterium]
MSSYPYLVEFYAQDGGSSPVVEWLTRELTPAERRAVTAALRELVAALGQDICKTDFGKNLGGGLIEPRLRQTEEQIRKRAGAPPPSEAHPEDDDAEILIRVFFHPHGQKKALVLHGYSKGKNSTKSHQQKKIAIAAEERQPRAAAVLIVAAGQRNPGDGSFRLPGQATRSLAPADLPLVCEPRPLEGRARGHSAAGTPGHTIGCTGQAPGGKIGARALWQEQRRLCRGARQFLQAPCLRHQRCHPVRRGACPLGVIGTERFLLRGE